MRKKSELLYNGIPYRGESLPLIKDDDPTALKPVLKYESFANAFLMNDSDQRDALNELLTEIDNNTVELKQLERVYDPALKTFCVFIHWSEPYYDPPPTPGHG